jgi:hypothetical protein
MNEWTQQDERNFKAACEAAVAAEAARGTAQRMRNAHITRLNEVMHCVVQARGFSGSTGAAIAYADKLIELLQPFRSATEEKPSTASAPSERAPMTREEARTIAYNAAKLRRPSYFENDTFVPHEWVIDAIILARSVD